MKRRIYLNFICILLPCILVLSAALSLLFHNAARQHEINAIKGHAMLVSDLLGIGISGNVQFSDYISYATDSPRMTVIAPDGTVLLDSRTVADNMENHMDRPEIIKAFREGTGEALRRSETFGATMYYYAMKLPDGNVLRISGNIGGVAGTLAVMLPAAIALTAAILLIANIAAQRLTKRIIAPLESIDFEGENTAVYDELMPYAKRINQQKQEISEKINALSERANTIETITGQMKEGLVLTDAAGKVLTANNSAREIFGVEMERKNISHICRDELFRDAIKRSLDGENTETQIERSGRVYSVHLGPVASAWGVSGAVILFHDATDRHRAEKQRQEFSANVSHELKTPLTTISALSEMIGSGIAKEDDIKGFATRISEQAGRLLALIDDIIRLSEFDEGGKAMENTVFDLWEIAERTISALRDNSCGIEIRLTGERFNISANLRMIDELLYNLIDNGVKYNKEGGSVTVDLSRPEHGMCKISVSDDCIGIPQEHQERIFERFYRVDGSRSKKTGGTGLGLSIVKHITELHGGRVELQSSESVGTTVICRIKT